MKTPTMLGVAAIAAILAITHLPSPGAAQAPPPSIGTFTNEELERAFQQSAETPLATEPGWEDTEKAYAEGQARDEPLLSTDDDACHYDRGMTLIVHIFVNHDGGAWDGTERSDAAARATVAKQYYIDNAPPGANVHFDNEDGNQYWYFETTVSGYIPDSGMTSALMETVCGLLGRTDADGDGWIVDDFTLEMQNWNGGWDNVAVPRRHFPLFEGNSDVSVVDIETDLHTGHAYRKWINFTDCPAARLESRTAPEVRTNRIDAFARALGIRGSHLRRMDRRPRYFITDEEKALQRRFWSENGLAGRKVVGVQAFSAEPYRDFPHVRALVASLALETTVLVFHDRRLEGFDGHGVLKVDQLPLRKSFALAGACDVLVAPDSSFVHFAAAVGVPCVALFGPIDGRVRTKAYPACTVIDARADLRCVPCWRNEVIPCKLTGRRGSVCMASIAVEHVHRTVRERLEAGRRSTA